MVAVGSRGGVGWPDDWCEGGRGAEREGRLMNGGAGGEWMVMEGRLLEWGWLGGRPC